MCNREEKIMSRDGQATYYDVGGIETADVVKAKLTGEQYIGFLLGTSLVYQCRLNWKRAGRRRCQEGSELREVAGRGIA